MNWLIRIFKRLFGTKAKKEATSIPTMQLPNSVLLPIIVEELEKYPGKTITLPLSGRSMRPFLEDGRDQALLTLATNISIGDAVLAEVTPQHFVLHRIIDIKGDHVTLRGDGNYSNEYCTVKDVKAIALGFYRKGRNKLDSTTSTKWRIYSWWWTRLYPIRHLLLFALHPHIPQRFKSK
jgi:hypothetical protein